MTIIMITCAGCNAEIPNTTKKCPHCGTPIGQSYKWHRGKKRLLIAVIFVITAGLAIDSAIDKREDKPLPHPHQILDAPQ